LTVTAAAPPRVWRLPARCTQILEKKTAELRRQSSTSAPPRKKCRQA
jgi:hypothetical protein